MTANFKNNIQYYRACLLDGGKGKVKEASCFENENQFIAQLPSQILAEFWPEQEVPDEQTNGDEQNDERTVISLCPRSWVANSLGFEHAGQLASGSTSIYPFWIPFNMDREGNLYPPAEGEIPYFIRDYLSPTTEDTIIIGSMDAYDDALRQQEFHNQDLSGYWNSVLSFFNRVVFNPHILQRDATNSFAVIPYESKQEMIKNILNLYNSLAKSSIPPVLSQVLSRDSHIDTHTVEEEDVFLNSSHVGQMSGDFPLSYSQRQAFAAYTSPHTKNIFAINGPPGTGKTTILQSIIANSLVGDVIAQREMSIIVGCSTNNQAITNILDSMKIQRPDDPFASIWIQGADSFGTYLTSDNNSRMPYQMETTFHLNTGFFANIDCSFHAQRLEEYFTDRYNSSLTPEAVTAERFEDIKKHLSQRISGLTDKLHEFIQDAKAAARIPVLLRSHSYTSEVNLIDHKNEVLDRIAKLRQNKQQAAGVKEKLAVQYRTFPFYYYWFSFIPSIKKILASSFRLITHSVSVHINPTVSYHSYHQLNAAIEQYLLELLKEEEELNAEKAKIEELEQIIKEIKAKYNNQVEEWDRTYSSKMQQLIDRTGSEYRDLPIAQDCAVRMDISYRYELFWNAVHLREWEYIDQLSTLKDNKKERGRDTYRKKLQRLSRVTPLFIATFHSLPKFASYYSSKGSTMYSDLFDLMIIDECGQVSPEVGLPALSFAKKVIAVGDVSQIEPVWGVTAGVDLNNALKYKVVKDEEDFESFEAAGYTCSSGSLMQLIRNKTPFIFTHKDGSQERGTYLLEHRRCLNPIALFSASYVYHGALQLMVGDTHDKDHRLPPLGYVHVRGQSEKNRGGSRQNEKEARAIVAWISQNKTMLERAYGKPLAEIVAVVAPFFAQKMLITQLIRDRFRGELKTLTVGTVHALQGAERPVILFSLTNDANDSRLFIDAGGKYNMLNVATTRAKHAFVVFGDMEILQQQRDTPSGNLAKLLFSNSSYAIHNSFLFDTDVLYDSSSSVKRISTLEEHTKVLKRCFEKAEKELLIFSPFLSYNAINSDNLIPLIDAAIARGVRIIVVTDRYLDQKADRAIKDHSQQARDLLLRHGVTLLLANGVHNKTILIDDSVLIEGSFNWLSATRDQNSPYHRAEASIVITDGPSIQASTLDLRNKVERYQKDSLAKTS